MLSSKITPELQKAIDYVKQLHPTLSIVIFNKEGRWQYMDEDFNAFTFSNDIDVSILNDASDSIVNLPSIFQL